MLVIVTGIVTAAPGVSAVPSGSGRAGAAVPAAANATYPVYGSDTAVPATGSANATISVQVPATGCSAVAVRVRPVTPRRALGQVGVLPVAEHVAVRADQVRADPVAAAPGSPRSASSALTALVPGGTVNW